MASTLFNYPIWQLYATPAMDIVDALADAKHQRKGRRGWRPLYIILHHTGGTDSRLWLSTTSVPAVSCHRLISRTGLIYKVVADEDTAYCNGFGVTGPIDPDGNDPAGVPIAMNECTLSIEFENLGNGQPYPDVQLLAGAKQIVEWHGKYGMLPILAHGHIDANKNDPAYFPWNKLYSMVDSVRLMYAGSVS